VNRRRSRGTVSEWDLGKWYRKGVSGRISEGYQNGISENGIKGVSGRVSGRGVVKSYQEGLSVDWSRDVVS
jgi:hypothetical protein